MVLFSTKRKNDYTSNRNICIMKSNTGRANLPYKSKFTGGVKNDYNND